MTDDDIDFSDSPELSPDFFARAQLMMPGEKSPHPRKTPTADKDEALTVTVPLEMDMALLTWFQAQGEGYEQKMLAALRLYAQAHQTFGS